MPRRAFRLQASFSRSRPSASHLPGKPEHGRQQRRLKDFGKGAAKLVIHQVSQVSPRLCSALLAFRSLFDDYHQQYYLTLQY